MLSLQMNSEKNEIVTSALSDCHRRIRTMARVHETLYQSANLSEIDAHDFLSSISEDTCASLMSKIKNVSVHFDVEHINIDLDQAVACGQIASELLANAFEHAFINRDSGTIQISLSEVSDGNKEFKISNDGIPINNELESKNSDKLGLQLVHALVDKLDGDISINNKNGTCFTIIF